MEKFIVRLAQKTLARHRPHWIAVAGDAESVIIRDAVFFALKEVVGGRVVRSGEYGKEPLEDLAGWVLDGKKNIVVQGIKSLVGSRDFTKCFVVEYPAHAPGKMKPFLDFHPHSIGILGTVSDTNQEFFASIEEEAKEKSGIFAVSGANPLVIFNADNLNVAAAAKGVSSPSVSFGFSSSATIRASDLSVWEDRQAEETDGRLLGMSFKLNYQGNSIPVFLPGAVGADHARGFMAGILAGLHLGGNLLKMVESFVGYHPTPGKLCLIRGIKKTMIIDDTRDANPYSMKVALDTLASIALEKPREKFAVLGSISHLGRYTEDEHRAIGAKVFETNPDYLVAVGEKARDIVRGAREAGMLEERCFYFPTPEEAGRFIQNRLEKGDLLMVSGGAETRMEKIVRELMAEPLGAPAVLVRQ
ncbi:MAG: UDP-N-acetylmuramoyl-tripeptide--D-alanyl-D-alanine ligase [Parcubacteria group bacterium Gr01-1014_18]|nr:MAG: UDP-N-acetylmuramoyl-tripeptide--D-alanyl-D-alanine ligase [Parcubacteria group bacterium Greene0416_36]TSC81571.1 MAG: UDP-N-acetylmuramoyl-tripeptide--D-alanyl-D-alanine ligase [Parcubacteria group bacterium Gr01-1014_18]TSC99618.1 MAG: UDP-N-acetylmuramoyl-tripeptide--D-alanyl-D-alanine ligase [Parcubacteria group bacterium Greene1014_20]TSD07069.1 MAG: UDP-N-acetylmuramoyl-tripeptide--D-alanyl-D-alanine ligase [Parcubacteria group bacterium Greene0714_2]